MADSHDGAGYEPPTEWQAPAPPTVPLGGTPAAQPPPYAPYPTAPPTPPFTPYGATPGGPGSLPPYGAPVAAPEPAPKRSRGGRAAVAVLSVFALLVAGGFAIYSVAKPDGAGDPETAVRDLFAAIDNEDLVGALETLPPSERTILRDATLDALQNLQRLGILSDFDPHQVPGTTFEVQNLQLASSQLGPDIVSVKITGGTISGQSTPSNLPIGDLVRDKFKDDLAKAEPESFREDLAKDKIKLAVVKEGRGWHVSLFYTLAELARGEQPAPAFGSGPTPLGSDSPEGVVRDLAQAGVDLDAEKAIRLLSPDEAKVLYDYSPLFLPDAKKAAAETKADGEFAGKVNRLDLRAEGNGSARRVFTTGFDISVSTKDEDDRVTYDGRCWAVESTYKGTARYRSSDVGKIQRSEVCSDGTTTSNGTRLNQSDADNDFFGAFGNNFDQVGVTVVEVGGRWYLSPTRTLVDSLLNGLRQVKREDVSKLLNGDFFTPRPPTTFTTPGTKFVPVPRTTPTTRRPTTSTTSRRSTTTTELEPDPDPTTEPTTGG